MHARAYSSSQQQHRPIHSDAINITREPSGCSLKFMFLSLAVRKHFGGIFLCVPTRVQHGNISLDLKYGYISLKKNLKHLSNFAKHDWKNNRWKNIIFECFFYLNLPVAGIWKSESGIKWRIFLLPTFTRIFGPLLQKLSLASASFQSIMFLF